jgi:hypothetical protein
MPQWKLGFCKAKRLGCTISLLQQNELEGTFGERSNNCEGADPFGIIQVIPRWNKCVYMFWDSVKKNNDNFVT